MMNVAVGIVWHTCLAVLPVGLMIREPAIVWVSAATLIVTSVILKKNWYDRLESA